MTNRPSNIFDNYHAHVYFDKASLEHGTAICEKAGSLFSVKVGRVHQKPVGPHPRWSCQLAFDSTQFDLVIPWLEKNRNGLTVFVHGLSGNDLKDHTEHASWLGDEVELDLSMFRD